MNFRPCFIRRLSLPVAVLMLTQVLAVVPAEAVNTVPLKHVYGAHLLNSSGSPITTAHVIRLSYWTSADLVAGDISSGSINTSAPAYAGWQEVQTFTPNSRGYFSVEMGAVNPLPSFASMSTATLLALRVQVEVKPSGSPDTAYEVLDPAPLDPSNDRAPVNSVPTAINADFLDQREIGTGSGSIPLLEFGGKLPVAMIPAGVNSNNFTIDAGGTAAGNIVLTFGQAINKTLLFNQTLGRFEFNDDLYVEGNLTVTGLINGFDLATLSSNSALRVSSGGGLTVNVAAGSFRLNGTQTNFGGQSGVAVSASATNYVYFTSGGLQVNTTGFPISGSFIALAEVVTNGSSVTTVNDRRAQLTHDNVRNAQLVLHPQYAGVAYAADGSDNVGTLRVDSSALTSRTSYVWSTSRASLQDYDIVIPFTVPDRFTGWQTTPLKVSYYTTTNSAAENKLDISMTDTSGAPVTLVGGATNLANSTWTAVGLTFSGSPTWTPGGRALVRLRVSALTPYQVHLGDLQFLYTETLH